MECGKLALHFPIYRGFRVEHGLIRILTIRLKTPLYFLPPARCLVLELLSLFDAQRKL